MEDGIFCEDILVDILSRLPKKSLSRFKCVSKGWFALISDGNRVLPKTTDVGFLCHSMSCLHPSGQISLFSVDSEGNASTDHSLGFSLEHGCFILDTCNGFVLYRKGWERRLYVYNPVTKHSVDFPLFSFGPFKTHSSLASDGKNYKVIRVFYSQHNHSFDFEIFSSQTCQWREIHLQVSPLYSTRHLRNLRQSVSLKGAIHLIWENYLLIYHLEDEYCKLIKLPRHDKYRYIHGDCIWDSEGFLHYCLGDKNGIHIWVLHMEDRNYNRDQRNFEWQLKHSVILKPPMLKIMRRKHLNFFSPHAFNDDFGIVYLMFCGCILSYNLASGMLKEVCEGDQNGIIWDIYPFLYSLVELPFTIASTLIEGKEKLFNPHMKDAMKTKGKKKE